MRSPIYSFLTTILLLVPVAAVPLMAIFGIPQFTPVIASPLDGVTEETEDQVGETSRRKSRSTSQRTRIEDESDQDLVLEESPDWEHQSAERSRSIRKSKARASESATKPFPRESFSEEQHPAPRRTVSKNRRKPNSSDPFVDSSIQTASFEELDEAPVEIDDAENTLASFKTLQDNREMVDPESEAAIVPGYRRQRPHPTKGRNSSDGKSASRNKRSAHAVEPLTWPEAVRRLNDLGIRNFRLESGVNPGEFNFACSYTPSDSPHVTRRFEAEADDPLKAVSKVLSQVEEAAQQRILAAPRKSLESAERPRIFE